MELVSLSLYAIPERLSQFLITEGPALWTFLRTGALGGVSTLNFTIHVTAQDFSVGIQQALQGYRARIRNHGHSCFLCEIVIRSQFHTTYEPEA
jgi:hypothetical protein